MAYYRLHARVLSVATLLFLQSFSYLADAQSLRPGFEINGSFSTLVYDEPLDGWNPGGSLSFGMRAFAEVPLSPSFHLQSGVRFTKIKNHVEFGPTADYPRVREGEFSITQNYISVPVHLGYRVFAGPAYLIVGPEFGYLLSSESSTDNQRPESLTKKMNRFNLALAGGLGAAFRLNEHRLHVEARLVRGLTGVAKEMKDLSWAIDWTTREFGIAVGYTH